MASQTRQILARWLLTGTCAGAAAAGLFAQTAQQPLPTPPARGTAPARGAAPARGGAQASTSPTNYTILGCIAREGTSGAAAQRFTITEKRGDKPTTYRLQGDTKELDIHVGHMVEAKGTLSSAAGRGGALTLTMTGLTWISTTCPK